MKWWATLLVSVAGGMMATLSLPVHALPVLVNGASCPTASVKFGTSGMIANLPLGCSSNGNPCEGATAEISATGLIIQAPPACLVAAPTPSGSVMRNVTLNGVDCGEASVTIKADEIALDAPASCQAAALLEPEPPAGAATAGDRAITLSGRVCNAAMVNFNAVEMTITAPHACLSGVAVPIIVSLSLAGVHAGQEVTITGINFAANASVTIGGAVAGVQGVPTSTSLTVQVPAGLALGPQPVIVTVNGQPSVAATIVVIPLPLSLVSVKSRKIHGAASPFAIDVDTTQLIGGTVTVEPRSRGTGHVIVFRFDGAVTSTGIVTAVDLSGSAVAFQTAVAGQEVGVTLPDLADNQRVAIQFFGINGYSQAAAAVGFLMGDVNSSHRVTSADIAGIKARTGQPIGPLNFVFDINLSGTLDASDVSVAKTRTGQSLF